MNDTANAARFHEGDRVEVATRFTERWAAGFEIVEVTADGCRVRRVGDGAILPEVFGEDDLRLAAPTPLEAAAGDDSAGLSPASAVLEMPATLDLATVEAIRAELIDAVDAARNEVIIDLDQVRFLDSYGMRLLVTIRRRAWQRDVLVRLRGGKPLVRALLDLVGLDPMYRPELDASTRTEAGESEVSSLHRS